MMSASFVGDEAAIRLASFAAIFAAMAILELIIAARPLRTPRRIRWPRNIGLTVLNTVLIRFVFPAGTAAAALWAGSRHLGLFNILTLPATAEIVLAILLLDLTIYAQHVTFHAVPFLFRLHQVHHADTDFDVTLGTRFHPLEMLLSMLIKVSVVLVLGVPASAAVIFETVLNATSLFNHTNMRIPAAADRLLRLFIVTPAMHDIHHSVDSGEMNANFSFNVPWWDRLFGTYRPARADANSPVGMQQYQADEQTLGWMLALPFRSAKETLRHREDHRNAA